jgi:hypothetical protein
MDNSNWSVQITPNLCSCALKIEDGITCLSIHLNLETDRGSVIQVVDRLKDVRAGLFCGLEKHVAYGLFGVSTFTVSRGLVGQKVDSLLDESHVSVYDLQAVFVNQ